MTITTITENTVKSARHRTFYLSAGPEDGPLVIFVHGWPELSLSWRHQLPVMASLGFHAIAPDMRGYGRSGTYREHSAYAQEEVVKDMIELLDSFGREKAIWVGHDWGSPTVWNIASHHPDRCHAVANLCVPYGVLERGWDACLPLVDRALYPEAEFPAGQWEYIRFYEENFARACSVFDANPYNSVKALFRKGKAGYTDKPSPTAFVRKHNGWYNGADEAPDIPRDGDIVSEEELKIYTEGLVRNGFFGPDSYYMNNQANADYAAKALNGGYLDLPVLFLLAEYDYTCECVRSPLADPMKDYCRNLTIRNVKSGHWMAQEKPAEVNAALTHWLATSVPGIWPGENSV
ncbi:alpha/beta hydrolase [Sneathiella sp.]|uniref:alpha/beta fold hydrolase n=1 Tax=Sneathiella sp. TaxID=1964365 RepID=UPI0026072BFF|nr:alpha/beta hydrolase [Sneathiella sp.]MDF2368026.1 alpha/beta hydrolase [Sneathiella sp.]